MSRWYRAYEGTVTDAKLGEAALIAECSRSVAIAAWHCILESCASAQAGGSYETNPRRVAVILGESAETVSAVFAAFTELGMLADGAVTAWKHRQYESDTSTERSRKHRERKKAVAPDECNGDATLQGRRATPPETETDTDTEEKILLAHPRPVEVAQEDFSAFWDAYPKRDGSADRKGAEKAFRAALKRAHLETIIEGAKHFREAMTARGKVGTEYIPQARTWLNGDRWNERYDHTSPADSKAAQNLAILAKYRAAPGP